MSTFKLSLPFIGRGSLKEPTHELYEILPSLSHDNKHVKTLVDSFATIFNTDQIFSSKKEVVGLEIHANAERISYHFIIPNGHSDYLLPKIRNTFKGSSVRQSTGIHGSMPTVRGTASGQSDGHKDSDWSRYHLVNLMLKHQAFLPLNTHEKKSMYEELVNALDHLNKGESVWVQMLFQPVNDEWQEEFRQAYKGWLSGEVSLKGIGVRSMLQVLVKGLLDAIQNMTRNMVRLGEEERDENRPIKEVNKKLTQPGFKSCIRILVEADPKRQEGLSKGVVAAFRTLAQENDFVSRTPLFMKRTVKQMENRKMPKVTINHQILCSGEVANLFKIPDEKVECQKLQRMTPEERQVNAEITKGGYRMGDTVGNPSEPVHFSTKSGDDVARTRLFVASPGGGKSTLIEQFVFEAARHGHGCAIFDVADGRLYERIIAMLPEFKQKIIAIDYTDKAFPPAFNFSSLGEDDDTRGLMFGEFFEQLFKTEDLARTQSYMLKAAMAVFGDKENTLLEFIEMLRNEEYRKQMLPALKKRQPDLYLWWTREFPKVSEGRLKEIIAPILVRLDTLLYNHRIRNILCQKGGKLTPAKWMDEGNIVVFNLSNGSFTESEQRMLMSLHNSAFWNATLAREEQTRKNIEPRPFHLIYDEPQTYMGATPMFDRAISKARKYRVSCNFFIQEAEQIIKEAPDLWKKILGMSPHLLIGPVSEFTARQVAKEVGMKVEEILAIKQNPYCWIVRTFHNKEAVNPFVMRAVLPRDHKDRKEVTDFSHVEEVKERNLQVYNILPKEKLNEDINARSMGLTIEEYRKALTDEEEEPAELDWSDPN